MKRGNRWCVESERVGSHNAAGRRIVQNLKALSRNEKKQDEEK